MTPQISQNAPTNYNFDSLTDSLNCVSGVPIDPWGSSGRPQPGESFDGQQTEISTVLSQSSSIGRVNTAFEKMQELSTAQCLSRPESPQARSQHESWLANMKRLDSVPPFDRVIINVFLGISQRHICEFFECFRDFCIEKDTPEELYLAMAAVGGLYCSQEGSTRIAHWLYQGARLKLLAKVAPFFLFSNPTSSCPCAVMRVANRSQGLCQDERRATWEAPNHNDGALDALSLSQSRFLNSAIFKACSAGTFWSSQW